MASRGFIELLRLSDLAQSRTSGRHKNNQSQWLGVAFEVAGQRMVAPMGDISEILVSPDMTPIPLTQSWMLGIANIRGRLLPITDLAAFLNLQTDNLTSANRKIMVIDQPDIYSGLLVDKVFGIQQFKLSQYEPVFLPEDSAFLPYNHGRFSRDDQHWYVFMPNLLIKDSRYLEAAL
ncbi:chemotaxis protein CheW [Psychrobacter sp. I-STPA10]|uniref:chemotaxis protein CheW n=1 Tax=Psychrobacter sp. I-STPA10 TaxID=2585769 RepID=UPI001E499C6C|nr:chemotaxis protein CheW [Psychrobacter sp. I-STPA10]